MRTFSIQTLGCKVNQYESEQIATLLRSRGLIESDAESAELRIINTCSVTTEAASKSRQAVRQMTRLPVLNSERPSVIVSGCWATSDPQEAANIPGVDRVLTHHDNVAEGLGEFLKWTADGSAKSLPLLDQHQSKQQRAFLKIQDGCDAHCTYCIIPKLRPVLSSKPANELLEEARRLVAAGHVELVLTGIFLSAYGQETALRRRQSKPAKAPLAQIVEMLCARVTGLRRLRLSSLEPGDLDDDLLSALSSHPQVVPHFHLPLQSGSDALLRKMNRQYTRDDFLRIVDRIFQAFDRPALTTDIIAGFPGETDTEFQKTLDVVDHARFIHIHAFPFSPRPGTAAARWQGDFVRGPVVGQRIDALRERAAEFSLVFRSTFVGQAVQLLVERNAVNYSEDRLPSSPGTPGEDRGGGSPNIEISPHPNPPPEYRRRGKSAGDSFHHGRCERYFDVHFESENVSAGDLVNVRIDRVTPTRTFGSLLSVAVQGPK